jgi:hypothetical protein
MKPAPTTYSLVGPVSLDRIPPASAILKLARLRAEKAKRPR